LPPDRLLSQEEIDSVFRNLRDAGLSDDAAVRAQAYDFRRPDRIAKDQFRAIHSLHENFARTLASSLSAYLRTYAMVNLVSVEQISFIEFTGCLPSPTCMITLGMKPSEGSQAVLEINPSLVFPVLEMLLGGTGKSGARLTREITDIEQSVLEGFFRVVLNDLQSAWAQVTPMEFSLQGHETEPQLLQILAPNEAVVAISIEVRLGDTAGLMNIAVPSICVKMLRQHFDQQWSLRRSESTEQDRVRAFTLAGEGKVGIDARLQGPMLSLGMLLAIEEGSVLAFDYPVHRHLDLMVNGKLKFRGRIVEEGNKLAFELGPAHPIVDSKG